MLVSNIIWKPFGWLLTKKSKNVYLIQEKTIQKAFFGISWRENVKQVGSNGTKRPPNYNYVQKRVVSYFFIVVLPVKIVFGLVSVRLYGDIINISYKSIQYFNIYSL